MMNDVHDHRVPIRLGHPQVGDVALIEDGLAAPPGATVARFHIALRAFGHPSRCACCMPRSPVAEALNRLFLARVRGEIAWFSTVSVLASPGGVEALRAALCEDRVVATRFRLLDA